MTIAGLLVGFFSIQWIQLPKWRLLGALIAVNFLMIGADLSAISSLASRDAGVQSWKLALCGGLLMGSGIGYFANWIRAS